MIQLGRLEGEDNGETRVLLEEESIHEGPDSSPQLSGSSHLIRWGGKVRNSPHSEISKESPPTAKIKEGELESSKGIIKPRQRAFYVWFGKFCVHHSGNPTFPSLNKSFAFYLI